MCMQQAKPFVMWVWCAVPSLRGLWGCRMEMHQVASGPALISCVLFQTFRNQQLTKQPKTDGGLLSFFNKACRQY